MNKKHVILVAFATACLFVATVAIADPVATIQKTTGQAMVVAANGTQTPAVPEAEVMAHDQLVTGPDGSMQILFPDSTILALGPDSRLAVASAMDEDGDGSLSLSFLSGTARVLSSELLRANPEAFDVRTPLGNIGIRGTEFGILAEEGQEVTLLYEGGPVFYQDSQTTDPALIAELCANVGKGLRDAQEGIKLAKQKMNAALRKKIEKTRNQLLEFNTRYQCGH